MSIYSDAKLDALKLESVGGDLSIHSDAKLDALKLESVGGDLSIHSDAKLDALKSVGGDLYIHGDAKLDALKSVGGYLYIHGDAKLDALKSVGGYLHIHSDAKLDALKSVGGYLYIHGDAKLDALKLESVGGDLSIHSDAKLDALKLESVGGDLSIHGDAKLDALKSVGGYLYIHSEIPIKLEKRLWKYNKKNRWIVTQYCSEWLLSQKGKIEYTINNVNFNKELFDNIRKNKLNAYEVFKIEHLEQRRIAYEFMDKTKMNELVNHHTLHETVDNYNNTMKIISFDIEGYDKPFKFLNCVCPSTNREYFLETKQNNCGTAKLKSFGLEKIKFKEEW